MVKRVLVRLWDDGQKAYVETSENWPSAAISAATGQWGLEGQGWRLNFDGDVSAADARRICEAIASRIQLELIAEPFPEKPKLSIAPDGWDGQ